MKLLVENISEVNVINESKSEGKEVFIEGIFMEIGKKNRNGRIYPRHVIEREVNRYNENYVKASRAMGELNHPTQYTEVNLERASHLITELRIDGDKVLGRAKILNTPVGQIVKTLLADGVKLGVSSRGFGSTSRQNGADYIKDDFHLTTIDIVSDPSVAAALVNSLYESTNYIFENGIIREKTKLDEDKVLNQLETFLKSL